MLSSMTLIFLLLKDAGLISGDITRRKQRTMEVSDDTTRFWEEVAVQGTCTTTKLFAWEKFQ
jgi:hypothetical protein